jgi:hypothetical protein
MTPPILTFIIPVKHQANARDWNQVKSDLGQTIRSIAAQDCAGWKAVIIANHGAGLPDLPEGFDVLRVDFPPNALYARSHAPPERWEAFRLDKGRRVLAGMLHAGKMRHVMIVDHDDFVSRRLTSFTAANSSANGWYLRNGLIWRDGSRLLYRYKDFSRLCGTSHIIRADLYKLPARLEDADPAYIRRTLGSHTFVKDDLDAGGTSLTPLPFVGAVYRTEHSESFLQFGGISKFLFHDLTFLEPRKLYRRLSRLRIKTRRVDEEFFGR